MKATKVLDGALLSKHNPPLRSPRQVDIETTVGSGRRMAEDIGIVPFDDIADPQPLWRQAIGEMIHEDRMHRRRISVRVCRRHNFGGRRVSRL